MSSQKKNNYGGELKSLLIIHLVNKEHENKQCGTSFTGVCMSDCDIPEMASRSWKKFLKVLKNISKGDCNNCAKKSSHLI